MDRLRAGWRMALFIFSVTVVLQGYRLAAAFIPFGGNGMEVRMAKEAITYLLILLVTIAWVRLAERRPVASVGLKIDAAFGSETLQGLLIGSAMMTAIFVVEWGAGFVTLTFRSVTLSDAVSLTSASLAVFAVGAFGEELLFRGYLFQTLTEGTNKYIAVGCFSLLFAAAHLSNPNVTVFSVINIALAGIWLSAAYYKTRSLALPFGLHFSWNFFQSYVFSFPVSGIDFSRYQIGVLTQSGPAWITGGTFGPEGGILTTLLVAGSTYFLITSPWIRPSARAWRFEVWRDERKAFVEQRRASNPMADP